MYAIKRTKRRMPHFAIRGEFVSFGSANSFQFAETAT
jgi:hypothetical protein